MEAVLGPQSWVEAPAEAPVEGAGGCSGEGVSGAFSSHSKPCCSLTFCHRCHYLDNFLPVNTGPEELGVCLGFLFGPQLPTCS